LAGITLEGQPFEHHLTRLTLLVAIKPNCDGCREFVESELKELSVLGLDIVLVSATVGEQDEWMKSRHPIVVAPALLESLEISWPPFYVLIDAEKQLVVLEGVVFGPAQVADEVGSFLAR
jgi:hypothetical protein